MLEVFEPFLQFPEIRCTYMAIPFIKKRQGLKLNILWIGLLSYFAASIITCVTLSITRIHCYHPSDLSHFAVQPFKSVPLHQNLFYFSYIGPRYVKSSSNRNNEKVSGGVTNVLRFLLLVILISNTQGRNSEICIRSVLGLSLIHISEPTRPY